MIMEIHGNLMQSLVFAGLTLAEILVILIWNLSFRGQTAILRPFYPFKKIGLLRLHKIEESVLTVEYVNEHA